MGTVLDLSTFSLTAENVGVSVPLLYWNVLRVWGPKYNERYIPFILHMHVYVCTVVPQIMMVIVW